jgi:hypothetical protein
VTLSLSQHSRAYALIMPLIAAQKIGPVIVPSAFYLLDPSNREALAGECVFTGRPASSKGKTAGDVQIKLHIPKAKHTPPIV